MTAHRTQVNIIPQTVATGAVGRLLSLAEKLDQFTNQAAQFARRNAQEEGAQAGAQAGVDQQQAGEKLKLEKEGFIGSVRSKAFNQAARQTYLKSLDNDNVESITRIATENKDNLIGFNDAIEAYSSGVMKSVDPASKPAVALSIDSMVSMFRPKIQEREIKKVIDSANVQNEINADERSRMSQVSSFDGDSELAGLNLMAAIDSISNRTDIDQARKSKLIRDIQRKERESSFSGKLFRELEKEGPQAAFDKIGEMSGKIPGGFEPDEWDSFLRSEQAKVNRSISRQAKVSSEAAKAIELDLRIKRGGMFQDPSIPANPAKGSTDRRDINLNYNKESQEWALLPVQEQVDKNVEYVKNSGVIPDLMIGNVNAAMRSGTVDQVILATDYISRLQEEAPSTLKDMPDESRAMSLMVGDSIKAGVEPEVALEQARKFAYGMTKQEKEAIKIQSAKALPELPGSLESFIGDSTEKGGFDKGIFGGLFFNVPNASPAMQAEYRTTFSLFMQTTNANVKQSQKLAFQSLKKLWSVTDVGGPRRFMKYSPESIYGISGVDDEWIENQFNEDMEEAGITGAILAIDTTVARSDQPLYPILAPNKETGISETVFDENNEMVTWRPDIKQSKLYTDMVDAPTEAVDAVRRKQREVNKPRRNPLKRRQIETENLKNRANDIRRSINARVFSGQSVTNEQEFLKSDVGKERANDAINQLLSSGRISKDEADQARKAYNANI